MSARLSPHQSPGAEGLRLLQQCNYSAGLHVFAHGFGCYLSKCLRLGAYRSASSRVFQVYHGDSRGTCQHLTSLLLSLQDSDPRLAGQKSMMSCCRLLGGGPGALLLLVIELDLRRSW